MKKETTAASKSAGNPQRQKAAYACLIISNLLILYQMFNTLMVQGYYSIPILTNSYLPLMTLAGGFLLLYLVPDAVIYKKKQAIGFFAAALVLHILPSLLAGFQIWLGYVPNALVYYAMLCGFLLLFVEPQKRPAFYLAFGICPFVLFTVAYICIPEFKTAVISGIVIILLLGAIISFSAKVKSLPKASKNIIKGAVVGGVVAGEAGAIVGAMAASAENAQSGTTGGTQASAKDIVKGAAVGGIIAGDAGAVVGAMAAKECHKKGK